MTTITACNWVSDELSGEAQLGAIFNPDTGKPVPDAFVVARWFISAGGFGHGGGSICYHVESVTTNTAGEYIVPAWKKKSTYRSIKKPRVLIVAYKPGYRWPLNGADSWSALVESHDGPKERLAYLDDVVRNVNCMQAGDSERNLLLLYKAVYEDGKRVAISPDDDKKTRSLSGLAARQNDTLRRFETRNRNLDQAKNDAL